VGRAPARPTGTAGGFGGSRRLDPPYTAGRPAARLHLSTSPEEDLAEHGSVDEILAVARLLAAGRINPAHQREALDEKALHDTWAALHPGE
jgi:hypothetical protein